MAIPFSEQKFKELVVYIATRCKGDPAFGTVKLNKLLFFSDFLAYAELEEPITAAEYIKLEYGPSPKNMLPIREEMESLGEITVSRQSHYGYPQDRIIPRRDPDLSAFTGDELKLVERVIEGFRNDNATQLSNLTHHFPGWQSAATREVIPYEAIFLSNVGVTENDRQWASVAVAKHGW